MYIQQIYTGCLAQASYYIESNGEAAVIDPIREPGPYLKLADQRKAKIKFVFETHFHADFVSGHIDLADKSKATIVFGPGARPAYQAHIGRSNELFYLGDCFIQLLHTPGHTLESSCFLLLNEGGKDYAVFTGDTLFVGDVGRPDLMSGNMSKEELASMLYDSLNNVIKKLPDDVIVYPGHGAGSACGKNLGIEKYSTIGEQKKSNYALKEMSRTDFIKAITENLPAPPSYFFKDASINIRGAKNFDSVLEQNCKALSLADFKAEVHNGALILDTRHADEFAKGFIKGSINIGLKGEFAPWVGTLIDMENKMVLICEPNTEQEVVTRLSRIGFENVSGYLDGGIDSWKKSNEPLETIESIDADDYPYYANTNEFEIVDVRRTTEFASKNIRRTINLPLEKLQKYLPEFEKDKKYLLLCKGGYRSMIAASFLKKNGIDKLINVTGGIESVAKGNADMIT